MKTTLLIIATVLALWPAQAVLAAGGDNRTAASPPDSDYESGKKSIEAKNWKLALEQFGRAATRDPGNADIHNYLGFAYRNSGNLEAAFKSYTEALRLEPRHKGAHEYVGEAYLMANNLTKAEEHLAALDKICFFSCEEYRDLKRKIDEFKTKHAKN